MINKKIIVKLLIFHLVQIEFRINKKNNKININFQKQKNINQVTSKLN